MPAFRPLGERQLYRGKIIALAVGRFAGPDGSEFERDIVRHPGAVSVVPVLDDGDRVLLVRQYRAAIDTELLEIPAGTRDVEGEPPEITARRELAEEVGMQAGQLEELAQFFNAPGFSDERSWVYLARDLEPCGSSLQGIEEEHMTVEEMSLSDLTGLIASGAITDAKTIIGLSLARDALRRP